VGGLSWPRSRDEVCGIVGYSFTIAPQIKVAGLSLLGFGARGKVDDIYSTDLERLYVGA